MLKKLTPIFALFLILGLLAGCAVPAAAPAAAPAAEEAAAPAADAAAAPADKGEIVFIPKSTSATFYLFLVKGAQDKAKELGCTVD